MYIYVWHKKKGSIQSTRKVIGKTRFFASNGKRYFVLNIQRKLKKRVQLRLSNVFSVCRKYFLSQSPNVQLCMRVCVSVCVSLAFLRWMRLIFNRESRCLSLRLVFCFLWFSPFSFFFTLVSRLRDPFKERGTYIPHSHIQRMHVTKYSIIIHCCIYTFRDKTVFSFFFVLAVLRFPTTRGTPRVPYSFTGVAAL